MTPKEKQQQTYREDVDRRLHYDVKHLAFARLRVDLLVIATLHPEDHLQRMRDDDIALLVLVREVQLVARLGQWDILLNAPRSRSHEIRYDLRAIIVRVDRSVQRRLLECFDVIGTKREKGMFLVHVFQ